MAKSAIAHWQDQVQSDQSEAKKLPPGLERAALLKRARELQTVSEMSLWLSSAGLKSPT